MSYNKLIYHIIFGTKNRMNTIPFSHERELYAYIYGIIKKIDGYVWRINGMPDHVHILASIPAKISISNAIKTIKQSSSIWMRQNRDLFPNWFGWAEGYAIKTYSESDLETVREYIMNQKRHHASISFEDEYLNLTGTEIQP